MLNFFRMKSNYHGIIQLLTQKECLRKKLMKNVEKNNRSLCKMNQKISIACIVMSFEEKMVML